MTKRPICVPIALREQAEDFAARVLALDEEDLNSVQELVEELSGCPEDERLTLVESLAEMIYYTPADSEVTRMQ